MQTRKEQEIFEGYIAEKGLKHSEKRLQILNIILKSEKHLTAEEIYERVRKNFPEIGQATVYRTLKLLRESGVTREIRVEDGVARYELLYGYKHHDHLICINCGRFEEAVSPEIEKLQERLAKKKGFIVKRHKLELYGICPECRREGKG